MLFKNFNLRETISKSHHKKGYFRPTPLQHQFNPEIITEKSMNMILVFSRVKNASEKSYLKKVVSIFAKNLTKTEHPDLKLCYQLNRI